MSLAKVKVCTKSTKFPSHLKLPFPREMLLSLKHRSLALLKSETFFVPQNDPNGVH